MNLIPNGKKAAVAAVCLLICKLVPFVHAQPVEQATVEAAMTLQILEFTEWPVPEGTSPDKPKRIGIFDSPSSLQAFEDFLTDPRFQGSYTVTSIGPDTSSNELSKLDAIFFSKPQPTEFPRLLRKVELRPIVLVGTFDGFLEQGGLVNLVRRQRKMSFEIDINNSQRHGIEYRAKLLRLASRLVKD